MALEYKDLVEMMKPTIYIDEFKSKIGDDDAYVVLSFYIRSPRAADDLVKWFEMGYDFVIDADRSPGEIKSNRYLVFAEIKRRTQLIDQMKTMIEDLESLTEYTLNQWTLVYEGNEYSFEDDLENILVLSPHEYRMKFDEPIFEMGDLAGLPRSKKIETDDTDLKNLKNWSGLI